MRKIILATIFFICIIKDKTMAQYWSSLGEGYGNINSLAIYNGELYAAGYFSSFNGASITSIAKWNGGNWLPVGTGFGNPNWYQTILALAVYNGELYAGGNFSISGGAPANNIAKWNGTSWSSVGNGANDHVYSMVVYNGELYAAGYPGFANNLPTCVAKWDGSSWSTVGTGPDNIIDFTVTLTVFNGALYAAGSYGGWGGVPQYYNIAKWDDTAWTDLNAYTDGPVLSMIGHNSDLYIGGEFTSVSSISANQVARWDGINWAPLGTGLGSGNNYDPVLSLAVYKDGLYAGGHFATAGGTIVNHIAKWNGSTWSSLSQGTDYGVKALEADNAALYVGGSRFAGYDSNGNPIYIHSISKWVDSCHLPPPLQPGPISGINSVCVNNSNTYSIISVPDATNYTWILPSGWTGTSTTTSINATVGSNNGSISVRANNSCGNSTWQSLPVTVDSIPPKAGEITGNIFVSTSHLENYSIKPVNRSTGYTWSISGGGVISQGQGNDSITVNWQIPGTYYLTVRANNNCGFSTEQKKIIQVVDPDKNDPFEIKLLPNPSFGEFYLKAKRIQDQVIHVEVFNMSGQLVFLSKNMKGTNNYSQIIGLNKMAHGLYNVKIVIKDKIYSRKIVIAK